MKWLWRALIALVLIAVLVTGVSSLFGYDYVSCGRMLWQGLRPVAETREERFLGKVGEDVARCRGDARTLAYRDTPWVDWTNYWSTGDQGSKSKEWFGLVGFFQHYLKDGLGSSGALLDLEYQRMELVKFNLLDNATYQTYVQGKDGKAGSVVRQWPQMRLPQSHPEAGKLAVDKDGNQRCKGDLIRHRTLTGICNDIDNPAMGASGQLFARNVQFEETFPELDADGPARRRHAGRIALATPDPQVISRKLFSRQPGPGSDTCNEGKGLPGHAKTAQCPYKPAPFFNVLAAFWIQFMTHDWFSHLQEARNSPALMPMGCTSQKIGNVETPLSAADAARLGCRAADRMERALIAEEDTPKTFEHGGKTYLARARKTTRNTTTAWWDASQIYGHDDRSGQRVRRDPADPAKLLMQQLPARTAGGDRLGYLPLFERCADPAQCPINAEWVGQEATAFPDNWTIGMSFFHNLFAREHNVFVDAFRRKAAASPDEDSKLRNPGRPDQAIRYKDVTAEELFQIARLVVSAEIAKIHTIEWTPQLLYGEPLAVGMNSNWNGLFGNYPLMEQAVSRVVDRLNRSDDPKLRTSIYSVFTSGPGIVGTGSLKKGWSLANLDDVNGGVNHFGSPFNFPEEFVSVYRLHSLVPDLLEYRSLADDPNAIRNRVPVIATFRAKATEEMRGRGLGDWALSLGRQRLGLLELQNAPRFLQNLHMPDRLAQTETKTIDVVALDIMRDRERGVPRFNEFRRQYGLKTLTGFDDFIDQRLARNKERLSPAERVRLADQERLVRTLREVYGTHRCDDSLVVTQAQVLVDGDKKRPITDCLGKPNGSTVDNVEDLDLYVGWHAETTRPHGFAISETQFQVFILNASRRLYSDRFFTSSYRPEFYSDFGLKWVDHNGPDGPVKEKGRPNGREQPVSPLKRVLLRTMPELKDELDAVVNAFDPWARDRGSYFSLDWKPRSGAEKDEAFVPAR